MPKSTLFLILVIVSIYGSHNVVHTRGPRHPTIVSNNHLNHQHALPSKTIKFTSNQEVLQDVQHLEEDIADTMPYVNIGKMAGEEKEFHYFKVHDSDGNLHLDGLEIYQALKHVDNSYDHHIITNLVDRVLQEDDTNNDGYLSYSEYVIGRQKQLN